MELAFQMAEGLCELHLDDCFLEDCPTIMHPPYFVERVCDSILEATSASAPWEGRSRIEIG